MENSNWIRPFGWAAVAVLAVAIAGCSATASPEPAAAPASSTATDTPTSQTPAAAPKITLLKVEAGQGSNPARIGDYQLLTLGLVQTTGIACAGDPLGTYDEQNLYTEFGVTHVIYVNADGLAALKAQKHTDCAEMSAYNNNLSVRNPGVLLLTAYKDSMTDTKPVTNGVECEEKTWDFRDANGQVSRRGIVGCKQRWPSYTHIGLDASLGDAPFVQTEFAKQFLATYIASNPTVRRVTAG